MTEKQTTAHSSAENPSSGSTEQGHAETHFGFEQVKTTEKAGRVAEVFHLSLIHI